MTLDAKKLNRLLETSLEAWRRSRLFSTEDNMLDLTEDFRAAQDGLGIAHRNPGEVQQDIIKYLWGELNRSATELELLERQHQELLEMDLSHLIVEYKQKREEKPRWAFQNF